MTKKQFTYEDWNQVKVNPFDAMTCGNCLTEHVTYGCSVHPEVAGVVIDTVGDLPPMFSTDMGFNRDRVGEWLTTNGELFARLRERFATYYKAREE